MNRFFAVPLTALCCCVMFTDSRSLAADTPESDGVWKVAEAVLMGEPLPEQIAKAITLTVKGEEYAVTINDAKEQDKGTVTIDAKASPKRMTIKSTFGPNNGKTLLAIYEMKDKDTMRVCYDITGKEFPKEFKSEKGENTYYVEYRRK